MKNIYLSLSFISLLVIGNNASADDAWFKVCNASNNTVVLQFTNSHPYYGSMRVNGQSSGSFNMFHGDCFDVDAWTTGNRVSPSAGDLDVTYTDGTNTGSFSIYMDGCHDTGDTCIENVQDTFVSVTNGDNFYWGHTALNQQDVDDPSINAPYIMNFQYRKGG
ncbi:MAG: hypothetical protein E6Q33_04580 [Neisseriales bacterium]|nr:MAG: hypothetical protein E6Q33_04580 [Neisseriales bacterium]